jgi:hypothetical protein
MIVIRAKVRTLALKVPEEPPPRDPGPWLRSCSAARWRQIDAHVGEPVRQPAARPCFSPVSNQQAYSSITVGDQVMCPGRIGFTYSARARFMVHC